MHLSTYTTQLAFLGVLAYCSSVAAQQHNVAPIPGATSAQGQLTVTLTVVASVGVVLDGSGNPQLMVANAATSGDNVSRLQPVPRNVIRRTLELHLRALQKNDPTK